MVGMVQVLLGTNSSEELVELTGGAFSASAGTALGATCEYDLTNAGEEKGDIATAYTTVGTWLLAGAAGDYEVRFTHTNGDAPTAGTLNTWLALSSTRGISLLAAIGTISTSTVLVEIRLTSSGIIQDSQEITLESEYF